jgi:predicted PurR-regulated permease PerM
MDMKSSQKTIVPLVVGIVILVILKLIGMDWAPAIILGAIVAIVLAFLMNRRENKESSDSSTGGAPSQADITALLATAGSAVAGFVSSSAEIANPSTREIAGKIGTSMQSILTELQKPEKQSAAPVVVDNLIEPAQSVLTEYLFLTKKAVASTTPRSTTIEQSIFPSIESAGRQTLSLLREPGKPNLTKLTTATTIPFERAVTMPPSGPTPKGSREIKPE